MLPRAHRATTADLKGLRPLRTVRGDTLAFSFGAADASGPKIACAVSKKVARRAVDRNRMKRRCREAVREHLRVLPSSAVGVVRVQKGQRVPFSELSAEVRALFEKALQYLS